MADYKKCDGCGVMSPDKDGLFIANNWTEVTIKSRGYRASGHDYIYCQECVPSNGYPYREAVQPLKRILAKFKGRAA